MKIHLHLHLHSSSKLDALLTPHYKQRHDGLSIDSREGERGTHTHAHTHTQSPPDIQGGSVCAPAMLCGTPRYVPALAVCTRQPKISTSVQEFEVKPETLVHRANSHGQLLRRSVNACE